MHLMHCNHVLHCHITGGDRRLFGEANYQLGSAFIDNGDPQTALMVVTLTLSSTVN